MATPLPILPSVREHLDIPDGSTAFDSELTTYINGAFMTLHQLGVGAEPFVFNGEPDVLWTAFDCPESYLSGVKLYVMAYTKRLFDPSPSATVSSAADNYISELEARLSYGR